MAPMITEDTNQMSLERMKAKIRGILQSVREESGLRAIGPPLIAEHFKGIHELQTEVPSHDFAKLLENAAKSILFEITTQPASEERFCSIVNLVDLALVVTEELELVDNSLPYVLLEELFDSQTIDSCQQLFEYLEARVERVAVGIDGTKHKGPVILRLCNELLRRLSKAEDTIFCGRILIFLSKSFPLSERSGLNLRGDFNVENTTSFDATPAANGETMDIDHEVPKVRIVEAKLEDVKPTKTVSFETQRKEEPLNAGNLYPIFWSLQGYFSNPTQLSEPENFETFKNGLKTTMIKFKAINEEQQKQGANRAIDEVRRGEKRKRGLDEEMAAQFNPKYLTSRELFELELSDLTFRRHVLVQALILIEFLLSLTPARKEKWADITAPNKSVQYPTFTLSPEDEKWARETRSDIGEYLQPNYDGRMFLRLVETILSRDKNWVQWKNENCLSFEKQPVSTAEVVVSMNHAADFCKPTRPYPHAMGAPALSRLWREAGKNPGLQGLKRKERRLLPVLESFRIPIKNDEEALKDSLKLADAEEAASAKASKIWRALRIASRDRFYILNKIDDKPEDDRNELEMLFDIERDEQENKRQKIEEKEKENSTPSETSRVIGVEGGNIAATAAKKELSPATLGTNPPQADTLVQMENTPIPR